jgi:ABC-2 type transport system ATP-binding protein
MITVSSLSKRFGAITAVDGVSFTVEPGSLFGLLGPNGAGKSTTINMIVGALPPDGGTIAIDGAQDPTRPSVRARIGNAPQALAIYEDLTGEENLAFFGRLYGLRGQKLKERVRFCLEFAGLTERRADRVGTYSGGMKRRLNMACAIVHDPPLILFDEPTVGVDPQSRYLIFEQIEKLRREGRTIVYTTHYMEEAQRLCDTVAIIDRGKILDLDSVPSLIARHGGNAVITAELARVPEGKQLPGDLVEGQLRFESDRPLEEVARLHAEGVTFHTLKIDNPDLESVFLNLTGRRLRD